MKMVPKRKSKHCNWNFEETLEYTAARIYCYMLRESALGSAFKANNQHKEGFKMGVCHTRIELQRGAPFYNTNLKSAK
jgi:hypothetical protein